MCLQQSPSRTFGPWYIPNTRSPSREAFGARKLKDSSTSLIGYVTLGRGVMILLGPGGTYHGTQVIALPELDEKLRKQCLHLLYKICKTCEMLPATYLLQQDFICVGNVRYCGGFADVSEGEYLGCRVAVKHLRIGTQDLSNKIFKVLVL